MSNTLIYLVSCLLLIGSMATSCSDSKPEQVTYSVSKPETILTFEQMKRKDIGWMDTGIFGLNDDGQWKWFVGEGRHGQTIGIGPKSNPFDSVFNKELFVEGIPDSHPDNVSWEDIKEHANSHWISNVYQDPATGHILAFLHHEHIYTWPGYPAYHRTGLAISKDGGKSFKWCGYIISPNLSYETWINHWYPENQSCNMGLANYIVKDGYFYIYYTDYEDQPEPEKAQSERGLAVARARVDDVIEAAEDYTVTGWQKYYQGKWKGKGLGGKYTPLNIKPLDKMHGDAAFNSTLGKYVLVTARYTSEPAVVISFSDDGITWSEWQVVYEHDRPQQYISLVTAGEDNEYLGRSFWVYYRWKREENGFDWARVKITLQ